MLLVIPIQVEMNLFYPCMKHCTDSSSGWTDMGMDWRTDNQRCDLDPESH